MKPVVDGGTITGGNASQLFDGASACVMMERAGFMRMMMIGEPRLSELVEKYKALGYEVEVVPINTEETGGEARNDTCLGADGETSRTYATVYVRKRPVTGAVP